MKQLSYNKHNQYIINQLASTHWFQRSFFLCLCCLSMKYSQSEQNDMRDVILSLSTNVTPN